MRAERWTGWRYWALVALGVAAVAGAMAGGAWRDAGGFAASLWICGLGGLALALVALVFFAARRDPEQAITLACAGLLPMLALCPCLAWSVPRARLMLAVDSSPRALTVDQLLAERPPLPAYVRLSGRVEPGLELRGTYVDNTKARNQVSFCRTPLLPAEWRPGQSVPVIAPACAEAAATVEGIVLPVSGPAGAITARDRLDAFDEIDLGRAPFSFDPATALYVEDLRPMPRWLLAAGGLTGFGLLVAGVGKLIQMIAAPVTIAPAASPARRRGKHRRNR